MERVAVIAIIVGTAVGMYLDTERKSKGGVPLFDWGPPYRPARHVH
jgi:hypothetical protein